MSDQAISGYNIKTGVFSETEASETTEHDAVYDLRYAPRKLGHIDGNGAAHTVDSSHIDNIYYASFDDASAMTYTISAGDLQIGESIEVVRADEGELTLVAAAGVVWFPVGDPDHTVADAGKSVLITRRPDNGGNQELYIRGALG